MNSRSILEDIINKHDAEKWIGFFRSKSPGFGQIKETLQVYDDDCFSEFCAIGDIDFPKEVNKIIIITAKAKKELSEVSNRRAQYEKAKKILKDKGVYDAGIFIYYDSIGKFRFSFVYEHHLGTKRIFNNFKRFTYFVSSEFTNKTFYKQIGDKPFTSMNGIKEAFSLAAVTDEFYKEFNPRFEKISNSIFTEHCEALSESLKREFALLFSIRIIFIGFIQKRKWIGEDEKFVRNFWLEYKSKHFKQNKFYKRWLEPLFFEALNSPPGRKVSYRDNEFSDETEKKLQMAPYLNGGLFEKKDIDNKGFQISDEQIDDFVNFLFSYNFTIEENSLEDEELELNPEFLGIIFERLVNKADGAVYTPRTEVDFMCRISLVKWLYKNNSTGINVRDLYELFFIEGGKGSKPEEQRYGSFSINQYKDLLNLLENITICDPAVGSGAFPVGMLHILDEIEQHIRDRMNSPEYNLPSFERKKRIISNSLYGVEVKEWAVWIAQLRLWITLFIDAPDDLKLSQEAILPSLDFKMRSGDSLIQRIGSKLFPVQSHADIKSHLKAKITQLKQLKTDYFNNKTKAFQMVKKRELDLFSFIIHEEIKERKERLNAYRNDRGYKFQDNLFIQTDIAEAKQDAPLFKDNIEQLEREIEELNKEMRSLMDEHPLIWNIEFAEIFADRGGFDVVIGNPPYVRQEEIADPTGKTTDKKEYKNLLQDMVRVDFPEHFREQEKINAKSDLYAYFYIRSLRLLNSNGLLAFICSNSWLDVGYGVWLQKFLLNKVHIHFIIDNHAKRSFAAADVNTIISVLDAPRKNIDEEVLVKFVAFKKGFDDVLFTENLLEVENSQKINSNERFRVYPITVNALKDAGTEYDDENDKKLGGGYYVGDKWGGKYLRAPDIFYTILEKGKGKLVRLGDIAEVRRGVTTGANEFFYLTDEDVKKWGIEKEFLKSSVKNSRECKTILINFERLNNRLFLCRKTKVELKQTNALNYIMWGEKQGYNNRPSCKGRSLWYNLGEKKPSYLNFNYLINEVGITYCGDVFVSDNFHEIHTHAPIALFLNSSIFYLFQNIMGRVGFGGGLLKIQTYELQKMYCMALDNENASLLNRDIESIFTECGINPELDIPIFEQEPKPLPDRATLDNTIFEAIGLTTDERKEVYRAVCQLVWNRISKAKSV